MFESSPPGYVHPIYNMPLVSDGVDLQSGMLVRPCGRTARACPHGYGEFRDEF
jgi:hypothetical protein